MVNNKGLLKLTNQTSTEEQRMIDLLRESVHATPVYDYEFDIGLEDEGEAFDHNDPFREINPVTDLPKKHKAWTILKGNLKLLKIILTLCLLLFIVSALYIPLIFNIVNDVKLGLWIDKNFSNTLDF